SKMAIIKILVLMGTMFAFSTYDPQYCYILDGILLLYCILITAFFVRERVRVYNKQTNTHTHTDTELGQSAYDVLSQRSTEEGRSGGVSQTYLISQLNIGSLSNKSHFIWFDVFNVFVFQGLSSMTKDTYDSLNMQTIHPPPR
uniref:Uncharacterized protein n=1 Tax=Cyprinus carpio TaxID=7962 RepID=A0A8C2Q9Q8_CYPCA